MISSNLERLTKLSRQLIPRFTYPPVEYFLMNHEQQVQWHETNNAFWNPQELIRDFSRWLELPRIASDPELPHVVSISQEAMSEAKELQQKYNFSDIIGICEEW